MKPALRVAFVITGLKTGGAEMMLEKLLSALSPAIEPSVLSLCDLGEIGPRLRARGVVVEALGMRPGVPNPFAFLRLVRHLMRLRPQVVHTWMYHADLLGGLAARICGVRAVMWGLHHSNLAPELNRASTLAVVRLCARLSHWVPMRIASAGHRARDVHVEYGYAADRMVVIPNGFELDRYRPDPTARTSVCAELGLNVKNPLVGMVGRFDPQKNHEGFAKALTRLVSLQPDVNVVMAGAGVDASNAELVQWLTDAGVMHRCHLLGRRDDIPRVLAALDVMALPSLGEAFPNVVGEAMACGVPCVVTDVGDTADIVGKCGSVVEPRDMPALADAIAAILALPMAARLALGEQAQERIRARFDIHQVASRYEHEYREMAAAVASGRRPQTP